jgi:hypothetical protein
MVGTFSNPRLDGGTLEGGHTDFKIKEVLKKHEFIANKKTITLPKYMPPTKSEWVLFCEVYKGGLDAYRGVEVPPDSDMVRYLKGLLAVKDQPIGERLLYYFKYLNSREFEVSMDAYREFAKADYADYRAMASKLNPDTVAAWLEDPKTPVYRLGLYASLLGHCGNAKHAEILRKRLDDAHRRNSSNIDGILAGYLMLLHKEGKTKEGLAYLRKVIGDRKQDYLSRYAALKTVRFFWTTRPDIFSKQELVDSAALLLDHPDMADFAVEDLRKWERWEMTGRILALFNRGTHTTPILKRAILRFALKSPDPAAVAFVKQQRARDPEYVEDAEEILRLEAPAPKAARGRR